MMNYQLNDHIMNDTAMDIVFGGTYRDIFASVLDEDGVIEVDNEKLINYIKKSEALLRTSIAELPGKSGVCPGTDSANIRFII